MKKLNIVFLIIIIILIIALGIMTSYYFSMRTYYQDAVEEITKIIDAIQTEGYTIQVEDEGTTFKMVENTNQE